MDVNEQKAGFIREADAFLRQRGLLQPGESLANRGHNNELDAFRHAYVSGRFAQTYGAAVAKLMGDYHELTHPNDPPERRMDLHNNAMGIAYARDARTPQALLERVWRGVQDRELILAPGQTPQPRKDDRYSADLVPVEEGPRLAALAPSQLAELRDFLQARPEGTPVFVAAADRPGFDRIRGALEADGRWHGEQADNIAGALLAAQKADPSVRSIDRVLIGTPTDQGAVNVFAVHQPPGASGLIQHVHVDAAVASRTPAAESLAVAALREPDAPVQEPATRALRMA